MIKGKDQRRDPAYVEKRKNAEHKQRERQQHQDNVEIVRALDRLRNQLATDEQEDTSDHRKRGFREWTTIILIFLTVVTAFGGDVIFYLTMRDARDAANSSHADSHETIVTNARAWLAPKSAQLEELPLKIGEAIHFKLTYQNLGKQPALDMISGQKIDTVRLPDSGRWLDVNFPVNDTCDALRDAREGQTIYPVASAGPLGSADNYELHFVSDTPFDGPISLGGKTIFIQGCLAYETFRERHYSSYCFYLIPRPNKPFDQWIFGICPNGGKAN